MYVLAALHLLRVFFHGSYKRPREANWLIGVTMFALTTAAVFTGTVLKWDQEGYEALAHNLDVADFLGSVGFWFSADFASSTPLLTRLYVAHIAMIPVLLVVLITLHALLIKRHGISSHPELPQVVRLPDTPESTASSTTGTGGETTEPFTHHLRRVGAFGLALLGALTVLAVLLPPAVGPTPVAGIEVTRPPWMFWWLFTLENWVGLSGILWGSGALIGLLLAVPFLDRNPERSWRRRPVAIALAAVVLLTLVVLSTIMAFTEPAQHLM